MLCCAGKLCGIRLHRIVKVWIHHLAKAADWATLSWRCVALCIGLEGKVCIDVADSMSMWFAGAVKARKSAVLMQQI